MRLLLLLSLVLTGCQGQPNESLTQEILTSGQTQTITALRKYCKACHAVAPLKFIVDPEDDLAVWAHLYSENAPSGALWAEEIVASLDWPDGTLPDFNVPRSETQDWMPKGSKRIELHDDQLQDGSGQRERMIRVLKAPLEQP